MTFYFEEQLSYGWLDSALASIVNIQETNLKRSVVRNVAKEIITICKMNRERVRNVETMLEDYSEYIPYEKKQEIFELIAKTLLYIQYGGASIKITTDPTKLLKK